MRLRRLLPLLCLVLAASSRPAFADATLFIGTTNVSDSANAKRQTTKGFAVGAGVLVVGVEFEYAQTSEDTERFGPSLRTGVGKRKRLLNYLRRTDVEGYRQLIQELGIRY